MNPARMMKYQPELNTLTGSVTATILLGQLEYWFDKVDGKPFYKFLAPCEDECYREGDSWCEELGFSKAEFRSAFKRIGKVYKSKKDYRNSKDAFGGKLYLSYYDRIRRRTYYLRNHELADQTLESLLGESSTNAHTGCPLTEEYSGDLLTQITSEDDQTLNTFHHQSPDHVTAMPSTTDLHTQVLELYHQLCPQLPRVDKLTPSRRRMIDHLLEALGGGLSKIRTLFEKTNTSDFLCGRLPNNKWRALFDWIITHANSLAILDGKYDTWKPIPNTPDAVALSETNLSPTPSQSTITQGKSKFTTMYSHNWNLDELEEMAYEHFLSQLS